MDGILLIDKPKDWTSHDVVAKVRSVLKNTKGEHLLGLSNLDAVQGSDEKRASRTKEYGEQVLQEADAAMSQKHAGAALPGQRRQGDAIRKLRVGHAGTLDPMATGLLIVLVGVATKQQDRFMKQDKAYEAELTLGATSTTDDAEGEIVLGKKQKEVSKKEVEQALRKFIGEIEQIPPIHSAIKVDGQRAYKLARKGEDVKLKTRRVKIYSIEDVNYDYPKLSFTVHVSSGTYIRSLARDIGEMLGTGAYLSALRRTSIGDFHVKDALSPEVDPKDLQQSLLTI